MTSLSKIVNAIIKYGSYSTPYLNYLENIYENEEIIQLIKSLKAYYKEEYEELFSCTKRTFYIKSSSVFFLMRSLRLHSLLYFSKNKGVTEYKNIKKNISKIPIPARELCEIIIKEYEFKNHDLKISKMFMNSDNSNYKEIYRKKFSGLIYLKNFEYKKAQNYFSECSKDSLKIKNYDLFADSMINLYVIYKGKKKYKPLKKYLEIVPCYTARKKEFFFIFEIFLRNYDFPCENVLFFNEYIFNMYNNENIYVCKSSRSYPNDFDLSEIINGKYSLKELSEMTGVSRVTLSNIINRKTNFIKSDTVRMLLPYVKSEYKKQIFFREYIESIINETEKSINLRKYSEVKIFSFLFSMKSFSMKYESLIRYTMFFLNKGKIIIDKDSIAAFEMCLIKYIDEIPVINGIFKIYNSFFERFRKIDFKFFIKKFFILEYKEKIKVVEIIKNIETYKELDIEIYNNSEYFEKINTEKYGIKKTALINSYYMSEENERKNFTDLINYLFR